MSAEKNGNTKPSKDSILHNQVLRTPRRKRRSAGSQLGLGAQTEGGEIKDNIHHVPPKNKILLSRDEHGERHLSIESFESKKMDLDLSFLLRLPNLAMPIAESILLQNYKDSGRFSRGIVALVRDGLVEFLYCYDPDCKLEDISTLIDNGFSEFLVKKISDAVNPISFSKANNLLAAATKIFVAMNGIDKYRLLSNNILAVMPSGFYNRHRDVVPRAPLSMDQLEKIWQAACKELIEIKERLDEGERRLKRGRLLINGGSSDYGDFDVVLATFADNCVLIPDIKELESDWKSLKTVALRHGILNMGRLLYGYTRDITPFLLLFAIELFGNSESIVRMKVSCIKELRTAGFKQFLVTLPKKRSSSDPQKVIDGWVESVLMLLMRLTQRPRSMLNDECREYLFVSAILSDITRVGLFFDLQTNITRRDRVNKNITSFCRRHGIEEFKLTQLRPSGLDRVGSLHGSIAAFLAAWHKEFTTTDGSYLEGSAKRADQEKLASSQERYIRFVHSNGKIDTRRSARSPYMDKQAATPGFTCLDPYESPWAGQRPGRLCDYYGGCPACPNASYNLSSPMAVAMYEALRVALNESMLIISPVAWRDRCQSQLQILNAMLQKVKPDVLKVSRTYEVRLPLIS